MEAEFSFPDEIRPIPQEELALHLAKFRQAMQAEFPDWELAIISDRISLYYFVGSLPDGLLFITPDEATLWVHRSYVRTRKESRFTDIREMPSYRDAAAFYQHLPQQVYVEGAKVTLELAHYLDTYFGIKKLLPLDQALQTCRMVKTSYELGKMAHAGRIHEYVLDHLAPLYIREGVSEAEFAADIYKELLVRGSQGAARWNMAAGEESVGYVSFGKSGLVPAAFDGPSGIGGSCIAVPNIGSAFRYLQPHQLVYMDVPAGFDGYHSDKTVVYYYGDIRKNPQGQQIMDAQQYCLDVMDCVLQQLRPGKTAAEVYAATKKAMGNAYGEHFMCGVRFLGHGIGLTIDEMPVLAEGFDQVLEANMTLALEPKIALPGIGMVGTENTYVLTPEGPKSLSGKNYPLRCVE